MFPTRKNKRDRLSMNESVWRLNKKFTSLKFDSVDATLNDNRIIKNNELWKHVTQKLSAHLQQLGNKKSTKQTYYKLDKTVIKIACVEWLKYYRRFIINKVYHVSRFPLYHVFFLFKGPTFALSFTEHTLYWPQLGKRHYYF